MICLAGHREELVSVRELAEDLRRAGNPVGIATIYRHLEKLEQAGQIHRAITKRGSLYQYCGYASESRECLLFRCKDCGKILHLDCSRLLRPLYEHLEQQHHLLINPRETIFTGLCDVCAAKCKEDSSHGKK